MYREKIKQILDYMGAETELHQTLEECAELIQAINKFFRYGESEKEMLISEIADVYIMVMHCQQVFQIKKTISFFCCKASNAASCKESLGSLIGSLLSYSLTIYQFIYEEGDADDCEVKVMKVIEQLNAVTEMLNCKAEIIEMIDYKIERQLQRINKKRREEAT